MSPMFRWLLIVMISCGAACAPLLAGPPSPTASPLPSANPTVTITSTPPPTAQPFVMPTALAEMPSDACLVFNGMQANLRTASAAAYATPTVMPSPTPDAVALTVRIAAPLGGAAALHRPDGVFLQEPDGSEVQIEATPAPAYEFENRVRWSPDGQRLLYITGTYERGNAIEFFSADGAARHTLSALDNIYSTITWSPDSQYVLLIANNALQVWSMHGQPQLTTVGLPLDSSINLQWYSWSPNGHHLAYLWWQRRGDEYDFFLTMTNLEDSAQFGFNLPNPYDQGFYWSPDGRWIAAVQPSQFTDDQVARHQVDLYGLDGSFRPSTLSLESLPMQNLAIFWSPDSGHLGTYVKLAEDRYDLITYDLTGFVQITRLAGMQHPPVPAYHEKALDINTLTVARRIAAYFHWTDGKGIDVLNLDGSERIPFITGADDLGDPTWSYNGDYIAAVWSTGAGSSRDIHLAWMRADGTGRFDLQDDYWSVHDLRWLDPDKNNGQALLAYIVWRRTGFSVEAVNLETGAVRVIAANLQDITSLEYDQPQNELRVSWVKDNYTGFARYSPQGEQLQWTPYQQEFRSGAEWHWSPDFSMVAVKQYTAYTGVHGLYLRDNAGTTHIQVRASIPALGSPVWSPDSSLIAFSQPDNRGYISLIVIDRRGQEVWRSDGLHFVYDLSWTQCR